MGDVTRRVFNTTVISGAAATAVVSAPVSAQACVSLEGVTPDDLSLPHDDELERMRHFMAVLDDLSDRLRYLDPQAALGERDELLGRLRATVGDASATLERIEDLLDGELALVAASGMRAG